MIGIVYLNADNKIIGIIPDVQSYTDSDVQGLDHSVKGIDLTQASFCLVESTTQQVGDTLGSFTDVRNQLPPSLQQQISDMQDVINLLLAGG